MSLKLLVPNLFPCLGDEERSKQAKLWVGDFPPLFYVGPNAFSGTDRSLRRHSENFATFFQGDFLHRRLSKLWDRAGDSSSIAWPHKGLTKCTLCGIVLFKLNTFLVMFLRVPSIDSTCFHVRRVYRGSFFPLGTDSMFPVYLGIKGDRFISDLSLTYKLVYYNLYHVSNFMQNCPIFMQNWMYWICM